MLLVPALSACTSRFTILDAARRIAFTQGCDQVELTLVEGYQGGYEATGCSERLTYRCSGGQCVPARDARPNSAALERAREASRILASLEDRIGECVGEFAPLTVQVRFDASGRVRAPLVTRPVLSGGQRSCVGSAILSVDVPASNGALLVSHTYE